MPNKPDSPNDMSEEETAEMVVDFAIRDIIDAVNTLKFYADKDVDLITKNFFQLSRSADALNLFTQRHFKLIGEQSWSSQEPLHQ
tara:strand:+ start:178 stop:432 length:255 start_codon:yes stop_codon:yes gene_type:complete